MVGMLLSFAVGFILFPLLYACLPIFMSEVYKRRRFQIQPRQNLVITDTLRKHIVQSLAKSTDVSWANVLMQRIFVEMTRNFAFEMRVRAIIMKNFTSALEIGMIKRVHIVSIDFGREAPYMKSIRLLGHNELESIVKNAKDSEHIDLEGLSKTLENEIAFTEDGDLCDNFETKPLQCTEAPAQKEAGIFKHMNQTVTNLTSIAGDDDASDASQAEAKKDAPAPILDVHSQHEDNKSGHKTIEFIDSKPSPSSEDQNLNEEAMHEVYKGLIFIAAVEYLGGCRISMEIELPRKIIVSSTIMFRGVKGDMLFRLPAENYNTRYEYAFAHFPELDLEVESGISRGRNKIFFQNSVSRFLRTAIRYSMRKTLVYPIWCQHYQGFISTPREIVYKIVRTTPENIDQATAIAEQILTHTSTDFKIISAKGGMFHRISNHNINIDGHIRLSHFKIPENIDGGVSSDFVIFEGLSIQESKLLNRFMDLSILDGVISRFKGLRATYSKKSCSLITLSFLDAEYDFLRIVYKDYLVFQRNDALRPDFFVFSIHDKDLQVFSYCVTHDYEFTPRRVEKLRNKIYAEPMATLGSRMLYRIMHFRRTNRYMPQSADSAPGQPGGTRPEIGVSELEDIFHEALRSDCADLESRSISTAVDKEALLGHLRDDTIRMRLFSETGRICSSFSDSEKIRTIVIEDVRITGDFPLRRVAEERVVYTYAGEDFIIDICIEMDRMFIYRVEPCDGGSILKLISRKGMDLHFPNYFVEALQLRISHERFFERVKDLEFQVVGASFSQEIKTVPGSVYFEFYTEVEDDFQFRITSCKKNETIFEIYKVISSRRLRILLPTENDFLRFTLIPKHRRNKCIRYRMISMDIERDVFVDGVIGLGSNCRFVLPMRGFPTHVIFWEKECDEQIKSYLEDYESRNIIDGCGIMRAECRDYLLVYKNTGSKKKRGIRLFLGIALKG